jgi:hypothetical protein
MKEPKVGDWVTIAVPSMTPSGVEHMNGIVDEILYDGSVNLSRDGDGKIPVAYGQKLQADINSPGVVDFSDIPF